MAREARRATGISNPGHQASLHFRSHTVREIAAVPAASNGTGSDSYPRSAGSLSTLIWLVLLRRRGLVISAAEYFKVGVVLAPAVLACAVFALWIANR